VRSCFEVFIVRNSMVCPEFNFDVWFVIYRFFNMKSYTHVITSGKVHELHAEGKKPTRTTYAAATSCVFVPEVTHRSARLRSISVRPHARQQEMGHDSRLQGHDHPNAWNSGLQISIPILWSQCRHPKAALRKLLTTMLIRLVKILQFLILVAGESKITRKYTIPHVFICIHLVQSFHSCSTNQ
jgi:hypothetical protein